MYYLTYTNSIDTKKCFPMTVDIIGIQKQILYHWKDQKNYFWCKLFVSEMAFLKKSNSLHFSIETIIYYKILGNKFKQTLSSEEWNGEKKLARKLQFLLIMYSLKNSVKNNIYK